MTQFWDPPLAEELDDFRPDDEPATPAAKVALAVDNPVPAERQEPVPPEE